MVEFAGASQYLLTQRFVVGEFKPGLQMRTRREHGKPFGIFIERASEQFGVAQFGQAVNVVAGITIGFGHGFPNLGLRGTGAVVVDQPSHRGHCVANRNRDILEGFELALSGGRGALAVAYVPYHLALALV